MEATRTKGQVNAKFHCVFPVFFRKIVTANEHVFAKMVAEEVEATSWCLRETIRVRELAATHRTGQMRRLLMLKEQKAWKREFGFDCIETAAEIDEKRFHTSLVSDPFFFRNMFNPRRPHTPDDFTLEMKLNVQRLRTEIILSQLALIRGQRNPERCDGRPRSVRGQMNPEYRESRHQRIRKKFSLLKPVWMIFLLSN